jgi:DNA-binding GntR family transcriptional regulator
VRQGRVRALLEGEVSLAEEYSVGRSTIHRIIHRPEPDSSAP